MSNGKKPLGVIFDIMQWVLIILMLVYVFILRSRIDDYSHIYEYRKQDVYTKIYDSQKLKKLEKENKELYDSLRHMKDLESVIQIKYVYRTQYDTVFVESESKDGNSIYQFNDETDSVSYSLSVKADTIEWYTLDFDVKDDILIVTREDDGRVETDIKTDYGKVDETLMWKKKRSFADRFVIGPQVGFGYDFTSKRSGVYVGVGCTFDLW